MGPSVSFHQRGNKEMIRRINLVEESVAPERVLSRVLLKRIESVGSTEPYTQLIQYGCQALALTDIKILRMMRGY